MYQNLKILSYANVISQIFGTIVIATIHFCLSTSDSFTGIYLPDIEKEVNLSIPETALFCK